MSRKRINFKDLENEDVSLDISSDNEDSSGVSTTIESSEESNGVENTIVLFFFIGIILGAIVWYNYSFGKAFSAVVGTVITGTLVGQLATYRGFLTALATIVGVASSFIYTDNWKSGVGLISISVLIGGIVELGVFKLNSSKD